MVLVSNNAWIQVALYIVVLVACAKPLGWFMARVYEGNLRGLGGRLGPMLQVGGFQTRLRLGAADHGAQAR